jgi:Sarcosine oxidase, gamma subunit family
MAETQDLFSPAEAVEIRTWGDRGLQVASLRYFDCDGEFARTVCQLVGAPLPKTCCATLASKNPGGTWAMLAWRSPTETLLLCDDAAMIQQLGVAVATLEDGCVVDQTGGACVLRARSAGFEDLLSRMAGQGTRPSLGKAKGCRLADVPMVVVQVERDEILLIVDRMYVEHIMAWIRISVVELGNLDPINENASYGKIDHE